MGFVFYDVETTGINLHFDQIVQFAAIHTDYELRELDRFEIRCRLLPHIVPSPRALAVTRVMIDRLLDPALPSHYEMVCKIVRKLTSWCPAIFLGWNSLEFDEHMLRQALYQCLHPPYLTNTNGNCRTDVLKFCQALMALQPGTLVIPEGANGKQSFRLDALAPANGFDHSNAHDAMADVEATVFICRLLRERAADHWSNTVRFSQKAAAATFMDDEPAFIATECYFGRPFQYALTKIGHDADNPAVVLGFDLDVNPAELDSLDPAGLAARLGRKVKPVRRIRSNASPILHEVDAFESFHGLSPDELVERGDRVRSDRDLCERLCEAARRAPLEPSEHVERQIYGTFSGDADRQRMADFHASDWGKRAAIVGGFEDRRLIELGHRLIFYHRPDALEAERRRMIGSLLARRVLGRGHVEPPWLTLAAADSEAETLLASCSADASPIVLALRRHIASEIARCAPLLS